MTLPLFDQLDEDARKVTLVRLAGELARQVGAIGKVEVSAEVHNPRVAKSGWVYFQLRDRAAGIDVVLPRDRVARSRVVAGERVSVVGRPEWDTRNARVSLKAEQVVPVGEGAIAQMLAECRARLTAEGLIDRPRRALPLLPKVIGVVCGADAAVRHDIESVRATRFPGYPIRFEETTVSGPSAADSILEAMLRLADEPDIEVIVLARGGGDAHSLLPWSDEALCRALAHLPVPVVSAIGHESDRPVSDDVADLRCGTPSIAAARVIPEEAALTGHLQRLLDDCWGGLGARSERAGVRLQRIDFAGDLVRSIERESSRLLHSAHRLEAAHPRRTLELAQRRLAGVDWRRPMHERIGTAHGLLQAELRHLRLLHPLQVLARGFAVATGPDGSVIRSATQVGAGDRIDVRVAEGSISAAVVDPSLDPVPAQPAA